MKIALINENSQAAKNALIEKALRETVEPMGHQVCNYGMYTAEDACRLSYVNVGLLAAILLNSGAADYVVTGCGTGEGAMLALNSFPNVLCGHVADPLDAFLFAQINDGNAVSIPYAKGFGWGGELQLKQIFTQLFSYGHGNGYPPERAEPQKRYAKVLDEVKKITHRDMLTILREIDRDFLRETVGGERFAGLFFPACGDRAIADCIRSVLD